MTEQKPTKRGRKPVPLDKQARHRVSTYLTKEEYQQLQEYCKSQEGSLSAVTRTILVDATKLD